MDVLLIQVLQLAIPLIIQVLPALEAEGKALIDAIEGKTITSTQVQSFLANIQVLRAQADADYENNAGKVNGA